MTRPGSAVGRTIRKTIRQRGEPSARPASRSVSGIVFRTTSDARVTTAAFESVSSLLLAPALLGVLDVLRDDRYGLLERARDHQRHGDEFVLLAFCPFVLPRRVMPW